MFEPWLKRWALIPDGEPIITPGSRLLPVRFGGVPAMLKIAVDAEEKFGNLLMTWWGGEGAARVYAHHGDGLLIERAMGQRSLMHRALSGQDDEASRVLCSVLARLHAPRPTTPPLLVPLAPWFLEDDDTRAAEGQLQVSKLAASMLDA